jgi:hypothetical protein
MRTRSRYYSAVACCPRPPSSRPRCVRPGTGSAVGCLACANGPSSWLISKIPIVRTTLPEISKKLAYKANRAGVAERFPEPAVHKRIAVDLALIDTDDRLLTDLELDLVKTAMMHEAQPFYRPRSIPGVGKILALVLLYAIHAIHRCPRVQAFVAYRRLVKCAKESAGKRYGSSGKQMGHASLQWTCSEAAVLCLRHNPAGQKYLARLERKHGQGKALTILAHQLARAVYDMLKRDTAFDSDTFLREEWSGGGEPAASRAAEGISLAHKCWQP